MFKKIYSVIFAILFFCCGLASIYLSIDSFIFDRNCVATMGKFDESYIKSRRGFWVSYSVNYSFDFQNRTYTGHDTISDKPLQVDTPVFFLPDNPSKNKVERGGVLFGIVTSIFMFYLSYFMMKKND